MADLAPDPAFTIDLWAHRLGLGQEVTVDGLIQKPLNNANEDPPAQTYFIKWSGVGVNDVPFSDGKRRIVADVAFSSTPITGPPSPRLVSDVIGDNTWVHIALTVDAARNATLYVNGILADHFQAPDGSLFYGVQGSIVIGNHWENLRGKFGGIGFNGCIDEIRIFDSALGADVINGIYKSAEDEGALSRPCGPVAPPEDNAPPTVDIVEGLPIDEGSTFVTTGSFTDTDLAAGTDDWSVTVDYDGSGFEDLTFDADDHTFELSHVYTHDRSEPYVITVKVDDGSGPVPATTTVEVNNVTPTVTDDPEDDVIAAGETYLSSLTFTDLGADFWTVEIDYGDGSGETRTFDGTAPSWPGEPGDPTTVGLSHLYTADQCGPFTVTVTVDDSDVAADSEPAHDRHLRVRAVGRQGHGEARS